MFRQHPRLFFMLSPGPALLPSLRSYSWRNHFPSRIWNNLPPLFPGDSLGFWSMSVALLDWDPLFTSRLLAGWVHLLRSSIQCLRLPACLSYTRSCGCEASMSVLIFPTYDLVLYSVSTSMRFICMLSTLDMPAHWTFKTECVRGPQDHHQSWGFAKWNHRTPESCYTRSYGLL